MKLLLSSFVGILSGVFASAAFSLELISVDIDGVLGDGRSGSSSISADGRFVAFASDMPFDPNDKNGTFDVYLRDRELGMTQLISVTPTGDAGSGFSGFPQISKDGNRVVFTSDSTDLVENEDDTNNETDIFVRDLSSETTIRVSLDRSGGETAADCLTPDISADGEIVVFAAYKFNLISGEVTSGIDIYRTEVGNPSEIIRVSEGPNGEDQDGFSQDPDLSPDGRFVVYESTAKNIATVPNVGFSQILRYDHSTETSDLVSVDVNGTGTNGRSSFPSISEGGRFVGFTSRASNLVSGDTNGEEDVFRRDMDTGRTIRVSVGSGEEESDEPSETRYRSISADGNLIAFNSSANTFGPGPTSETQVYIRSVSAGTTTLISRNLSGEPTNEAAAPISISSDGTAAVFDSRGSDLVAEDTTFDRDIFVWSGELDEASNAAAKASLRKQLRKLKKKVQVAKRKKQVAKVKRLNRSIRKLRTRLRRL